MLLFYFAGLARGYWIRKVPKELHTQKVILPFFCVEYLFTVIGLCFNPCILTTHICVENTVLASMNCFLFNLSYNVMIMCEWQQYLFNHQYDYRQNWTALKSCCQLITTLTKFREKQPTV